MTCRLAALAVLVTAAPLTAQTCRPTDCHPVFDSLRTVIRTEMERAHIPGVAVAVMDSAGRMLWSEAFGVRTRGDTARVTLNTLFSAQSISKVFTATAVLAAVRDGLLELDTPISRYLPALRLQSRFEPRPQDAITLRLLLAHHAGLTHEAPRGNNYDEGDVSFREHAASISDTWLRFPVGQRFAYSNLGIDLAGLVLEAATGAPFAEYVHAAVLAPLGLVHSTFDTDRILAARDRATGHASGYDAIPVITPMLPSGGAYVTAPELARFALLHMNRGSGRAEMQRMHAPLPGQTVGYGLGLGIVARGGQVRLAHAGGGFGFLDNMALDPACGMAAVALTNATGHDLAERITDAVLRALCGHGVTPVAADTPVDAAPHDSTLAGTYVYGSGGVMYVLWKDGKLGVGSLENFRPFHFRTAADAWHELDGERFHYRFVRDSAHAPAYLQRLHDGSWLDYLRPVPVAPVPPRWQQYTGRWRHMKWGVPQFPVTVEERAGVLFLGRLPLVEYRPGLFFAPHGEALDFRGAVPLWRGVPLERVQPADTTSSPTAPTASTSTSMSSRLVRWFTFAERSA